MIAPDRDDRSIDLHAYLREGIQYSWLEAFHESLRQHVAYVMEAGERLHVPPLQLAMHDSSKQSDVEFAMYARQWHGDQGDPEGWARAWLHHQNVNPHHWEYWVMRSGHTTNKNDAHPGTGALPMPDVFMREMIADWMGAQRTYTGKWSIREWWNGHHDRMILHPRTRLNLVAILTTIDYGENVGI